MVTVTVGPQQSPAVPSLSLSLYLALSRSISLSLSQESVASKLPSFYADNCDCGCGCNPNVYVPNVHVCVYAHSVLFVCVH